MPEIMTQSSLANQIKLIRKYLKAKIMEDNITFRGHTTERNNVYDLMKRTICNGESHSALIIGPRGSGKTTLINSVLHQLNSEVDLANDAIIVQLDGLVHHDEKIALKSITAQMQLENAVGDRVFGTFAENLSFLLSCLMSGSRRHCRSMVFVLSQFDMFCHSGRSQTLLYNLFDITHANQAPMCVLGVTNRIDVMDLLEKRVKSRFSHRHIFIFPIERNGQVSTGLDMFKQVTAELLSLPVIKVAKKKKGKKPVTQEPKHIDSSSLPIEIVSKCNIDISALDHSYIEDWNAHVNSLIEDDKVIDAIEKYSYYTVNEQTYRNVLFQIISKLGSTKPYIDSSDFLTTIDNTIAPEYKIKLLHSLSVLEFSLVIAMLHGQTIFDGQPMNFEMVLHRYQKFASSNASSQTVPRPVILKAFEHLQALELIVPATGAIESHVQREYRVCCLCVSEEQVKMAAASCKLPTELVHWLNNSVL